MENNTGLSDLMQQDEALERELDDLIEERKTLGPKEVERKRQIKERTAQIGKERLRLFQERRELRDQPPVQPEPIQEPPKPKRPRIRDYQQELFEDLYCDGAGHCYSDADPGL
jgi:hypothetical protein